MIIKRLRKGRKDDGDLPSQSIFPDLSRPDMRVEKFVYFLHPFIALFTPFEDWNFILIDDQACNAWFVSR